MADRNRPVARLEHEEYYSTAGTRCSGSLRAGPALWSRSWPMLVRLHDTAARSRFPKCRHISFGHRRADWCIRPRSHGGDRCSGDFREPRSALARLERAIIGHKDRSYCLRRARHPGRNYRGLVLRVPSAGKLSGCKWNPPLRPSGLPIRSSQVRHSARRRSCCRVRAGASRLNSEPGERLFCRIADTQGPVPTLFL